MKLTSNDYGACPNCTCRPGPENGNGKTSSITLPMSGEGQHNYLVNETTYAVTPPAGRIQHPGPGHPFSRLLHPHLQKRREVRLPGANGVNLKTTPGKTAKLVQIKDPYGNQLNFTYTGNNLTGITDNLGISGPHGTDLYLLRAASSRDITDWTGRKWSFAYDSIRQPAIGHEPDAQDHHVHLYLPASHNLTQVTLPESARRRSRSRPPSPTTRTARPSTTRTASITARPWITTSTARSPASPIRGASSANTNTTRTAS